MIGPNIPEIQKGDKITASFLNTMRKWVMQLSRIHVGDSLSMVESPGGVAIRYSAPDEFWVKITSGTNPYAWTKMIPAAAGTFVADGSGLTGTTSSDPAYEDNGNAGILANTIVKVKRAHATNELRFQFDTC